MQRLLVPLILRHRLPVALAAALLLAPAPAVAVFHFAQIERVMTGLGGTTDVQYVEIRMNASGQNLVKDNKLVAFAADGSFDHVVLVVPANVTSGNGRPWIMASAAFEAASGIEPDFVFDSTEGNGLPPESGMVCWGKPGDETDPDDPDMIDCVSYGNYTGPPNGHTSAPSTTTPFGHGLVRVASTHSSADDFACEDPALPRNNVPESGEIAATTPCDGGGQCGDGEVGGDETCDDGDTLFAAGDACSADCLAFGCGVPTSVTSDTPRTSDALFVLKAAVSASNCALAVCDVNASGTVTSSDALLVLRKAVGQEMELSCPA